MKLVILESPYAGDVEGNVAYARKCLRDSLDRGEAPIMSHLLHTQVLDDNVPDDRARGIAAGVAWARVADAMILYMDRGMSSGMQAAERLAKGLGVPVEYRWLGVGTG